MAGETNAEFFAAVDLVLQFFGAHVAHFFDEPVEFCVAGGGEIGLGDFGHLGIGEDVDSDDIVLVGRHGAAAEIAEGEIHCRSIVTPWAACLNRISRVWRGST